MNPFEFNAGGDILPLSQYLGIVFGLIGLGIGTTALFYNMFTNRFDKSESVSRPSKTGIIVGVVVYFVLAITGILIAAASDDPYISALGFVIFMLPTAFVCALVTAMYEAEDIVTASKYTAATITLMATAAMAFPQFFLSLGGILGVALMCLVIVSIIGLFTPGPRPIWVVYAGVAIFALYIGYDVSKLMAQPHTANNAVDSSLKIWIDIVNLFLDILEAVARSKK